jgi:hypothetical protein
VITAADLETPEGTRVALASSVVHMEPLLLRRRDVAAALGVSESVVLAWERAQLLRPVRLPGLRSVRHARQDVEALAARIRAGSVQEGASDGAPTSSEAE